MSAQLTLTEMLSGSMAWVLPASSVMEKPVVGWPLASRMTAAGGPGMW